MPYMHISAGPTHACDPYKSTHPVSAFRNPPQRVHNRAGQPEPPERDRYLQREREPSHEGAPLPGRPAPAGRRVRGGGAGLRLLLPRAPVAGVVLRHEAELLLPAVRQAGGGLRDPRAVAQPRRRLLPAELQPQQRLRSLQGERSAEQPPHQLADAGVPDQRRPQVLGARVGEARHLRPEHLQRARLLPDRPPPPRPAQRPRRPRLRGHIARRRLLHAGRDQGRHPAGDRLRALRRLQPRRVREHPALPALLLRRRRRLGLRGVPCQPRRQALRQQGRVPGLLIRSKELESITCSSFVPIHLVFIS